MRASRLLHLLLLLQTRRRMTTTELAERLEVSRRTVLRDVEALSAAGVPVYTERGRHGGVALLPGARLDTARLDPPELEALSVTGLDERLLARLGLTAVHETAARKIAARQAGMPGEGTRARLVDVVLVESTAWLADERTEVDVAELAEALRHRRRLRIRYRRSAEARTATLVVDPYGLVVKAGRWYLVADDGGAGRLFALERLAAYELLEQKVRLRAGQTLRTVWTALREHTETAGQVEVTALLRTSRLDLARRILGARLGEVRDTGRTWCTVVVRYPDVESVRQLLQFGDHIEVLGPAAARDRVRTLAADLAARHSSRTR